MVLITFKPGLAKHLIAQWENKSHRSEASYQYFEEKIQAGKWDEVQPIWVTPNLILNTWFTYFLCAPSLPSLKPFVLYSGNHRLEKAIEHSLPLKAYVRYTPGNPEIPLDERISLGFD